MVSNQHLQNIKQWQKITNILKYNQNPKKHTRNEKPNNIYLLRKESKPEMKEQYIST